jgi:hypothetical protein
MFLAAIMGFAPDFLHIAARRVGEESGMMRANSMLRVERSPTPLLKYLD